LILKTFHPKNFTLKTSREKVALKKLPERKISKNPKFSGAT
jgi:hypothetical protein